MPQILAKNSVIGGTSATPNGSTSLIAYCLLLPGKKLHLSALLAAKKFRGKGNKDGAVAAFQELERIGLGTLSTEESRRGTSAVSGIIVVRVSTIVSDNNQHISVSHWVSFT